MEIYKFAYQIIKEAGRHIRETIDEELEIETKSNPNDLVTNMDKETEERLFNNIKATYPEHFILGEEGHGKDIENTKGVLWIMDPIDGTLNFVHQKENFAISIGIYIDGKKYAGFVYDVMNDKMYHALVGKGAWQNDKQLKQIENTELKSSLISTNPLWLTKEKLSKIYMPIIDEARSTRAYGSAALDFVHVARGITSAYLTMRLHPWDFAGGLIIAEEVGAVVTNLLGQSLNILEANSIVVGNKQIHDELLTQYFLPHKALLEEIHTERFKKNG
ncbi:MULTISPECIES: inositol monophosphatase family protein [Mammaliicoccus]|uniref:inositol-phosphate phosphatase n=1 Tax=Mammaliicoccus lentus TaxID=42858 RepID=A0AAP1RS29_MAMLE|nr:MULTISPECIES: inositol monophosphatase family protein [Mammaliicoccus]HBV05072.1 inositol monophosphatase family protein [Staphylococcus sp.]MBF0750267.1 inositol monophosphatase family protein [Mammaliicoccus lentus]MBF0793713.1 inositol monophosphatase family protein [Mammaliicoccus lentus]MBF0841653.1 inositol monophosphatase family protein [Mammaliicoccus lentus]MBU6112395.1 inositol monophosphatase family protein [Mammaliicoccus lentus]